jgi:hypothetical protein
VDQEPIFWAGRAVWRGRCGSSTAPCSGGAGVAPERAGAGAPGGAGRPAPGVKPTGRDIAPWRAWCELRHLLGTSRRCRFGTSRCAGPCWSGRRTEKRVWKAR